MQQQLNVIPLSGWEGGADSVGGVGGWEGQTVWVGGADSVGGWDSVGGLGV